MFGDGVSLGRSGQREWNALGTHEMELERQLYILVHREVRIMSSPHFTGDDLTMAVLDQP